MHLGNLSIQVASIQDHADLIAVTSGNNIGVSAHTTAILANALVNAVNNGLIPDSAWQNMQLKKDHFNPLNINTKGITEVELVFADQAQFTNGINTDLEALYGYDVNIQFVYIEESTMSYEEKVAEFNEQEVAVNTVILQ